MAQWKLILLGTMRLQVESLASLSGVKDPAWRVSCGAGRRKCSNLVLLWLQCRLTAVTPIRLLVWEPPWAAGAAQKGKKKKKKNLLETHSHSRLWEEEPSEQVHLPPSQHLSLLGLLPKPALVCSCASYLEGQLQPTCLLNSVLIPFTPAQPGNL